MSVHRLLFRFLAALPHAVLLLACSRSSTSVAPRLPPATDRAAIQAERRFDPHVCSHLRGGPAGTSSPASDLGRAHALVRYFGVDGDTRMADARLADALDTAAPATAEAVVGYRRRVDGTCVVPADSSALGSASIVLDGEIAVVTPGSGTLPALPAIAKAMAIDVRELPDTPEAQEAVLRALAPAIRGEVVLARTEERRCNGQPDEVNRFVSRDAEQYACKIHASEQRLTGGTRELPLAVLTAPRLTPLAAWVAVVARARLAAFVVGEDVPTAIAESRWVGIGQMGMAVRVGRLIADDGTPLPDVVRADYRTLEPRAALRDVKWTSTRTPLQGPSERLPISSSVRPTDWTPLSTRVGDGRAALITAYAATRTFFPYTGEIEDVFDARLDEALAILETGPEDRSIVRKALQRFSEALHDGHSWIYDDRKLALSGSAVALVPVANEFAVAASSFRGTTPGDVVLGVAGTPTAESVAQATKYTSGSPQSVRARVAERLVPTGVTIEIRRSNGTSRSITIPAGTPSSTTHGMFDRKAGPLTELGSPDVFYLTLDASSPHGPNERNLRDIEDQMRGKRGVILDMRGYPSRTAWAILAYIASPSSRGPKMAELIVTPSSRTVGPFLPLQDLGMWTSTKQGYDGPVVVLAGANTQSQAEHWLSFFRSENRGKVVGVQTSGANGTITGVQLPGGYGLTFTGMLVRHTDGSPFHAIGHIPDIVVEPTLEDLRHGRDTVLLRALAELDREQPRAPNTAK